MNARASGLSSNLRCRGGVALWTPFVSATGKIRNVSLTGVSVALDSMEPKITPGTSAMVTIGDTTIHAKVRHVGQQDRPWDPCYGLEFVATRGEIARCHR